MTERLGSCLVTGGAGFIGSHLVRRLAQEGVTIKVLDDLSTGRAANIEGLDVELITGDLLSVPLRPLLAGVDVVFHLAAIPSVPRSVRDPMRSHQAAATATLRLLLAARDGDVKRVISSSSSSVYGNATSSPVRESMPTVPRSPYAVAKLAAEGYIRTFANLHGMATMSLRYFNVFGPRQDPMSEYAAAIPRFITHYIQRKSPHVYGDGRQTRDFTYVDNVVEANLLAARVPGLTGHAVNIATGAPRSVLDVLDAIADSFGYRLEPSFGPPRSGDISNSHADISLAGELLGFRPTVLFDEGLRRTIEWQRATAALA